MKKFGARKAIAVFQTNFSIHILECIKSSFIWKYERFYASFWHQCRRELLRKERNKISLWRSPIQWHYLYRLRIYQFENNNFSSRTEKLRQIKVQWSKQEPLAYNKIQIPVNVWVTFINYQFKAFCLVEWSIVVVLMRIS